MTGAGSNFSPFTTTCWCLFVRKEVPGIDVCSIGYIGYIEKQGQILAFGLFRTGTGPGTKISGSKSPRGLIQSLGGWIRTDFCTHNGRRRYGLDGMD